MSITALDPNRTRSLPSLDSRQHTLHASGGPRLSAVPNATEARGFALYIGVDEFTAATAGVTLTALVTRLRETIRDLVPEAETYATVALAPRGAGGRDVDVVRAALHEPTATQRAAEPPSDGVVVDLTRHSVTVNGQAVPLTYTEFRLLRHLVVNEGRTIERAELLDALWQDNEEETPNERTVDVHIRRLRAKLGEFQGIVRTVRGEGYRFDRHADVTIQAA